MSVIQNRHGQEISKKNRVHTGKEPRAFDITEDWIFSLPLRVAQARGKLSTPDTPAAKISSLFEIVTAAFSDLKDEKYDLDGGCCLPGHLFQEPQGSWLRPGSFFSFRRW
ncbi:MAG: hypothetical protein LAN84_04435 [Acidobacteriia bacterium]|nr:hypothetical protein [Terriglobia bacterium]